MFKFLIFYFTFAPQLMFPLIGSDMKNKNSRLPAHWAHVFQDYIKLTTPEMSVSISMYAATENKIVFMSIYHARNLRKVIYLLSDKSEIMKTIKEDEIKDEIHGNASCVVYKNERFVFFDSFDYTFKLPDPELGGRS